MAMALSHRPATAGDGGDVQLDVTPLYQNDYPDLIDNSKFSIADQGCTLTAWTMLINYEIKKIGLHDKGANGTRGALIQYTPADINRLMNDYRQAVPGKGTTINGYGETIGNDGKPIGSTTDLNLGGMFAAVQQDTKSRSFENKGLVQKDYISDQFPSGKTVDSSYTSLLSQLKADQPVVVRVLNDQHTVLVTSFHQAEGQPAGTGRYDIKDPFRASDGTSIDMLDDPEYKNRIYYADTEVFQSGGRWDPYQTPSPYYIDPSQLLDPTVNPDQYGPQVMAANEVFATSVPEPSSLVLLALGAACVHLAGRTGSRRDARVA
jgi:hypothetical protein